MSALADGSEDRINFFIRKPNERFKSHGRTSLLIYLYHKNADVYLGLKSIKSLACCGNWKTSEPLYWAVLTMKPIE
jgi:hypothetical protein